MNQALPDRVKSDQGATSGPCSAHYSYDAGSGPGHAACRSESRPFMYHKWMNAEERLKLVMIERRLKAPSLSGPQIRCPCLELAPPKMPLGLTIPFRISPIPSRILVENERVRSTLIRLDSGGAGGDPAWYGGTQWYFEGGSFPNTDPVKRYRNPSRHTTTRKIFRRLQKIPQWEPKGIRCAAVLGIV